jgi:hypothetical protein
VPTNLCATNAVVRLKRKGFPADQILHVVGEQAAMHHDGMFKHETIRVTEYEHSDQIQLIVATVQVLPRIFLLKDTKKGLFQKSPLLVAVSHLVHDNIYMYVKRLSDCFADRRSVCLSHWICYGKHHCSRSAATGSVGRGPVPTSTPIDIEDGGATLRNYDNA